MYVWTRPFWGRRNEGQVSPIRERWRKNRKWSHRTGMVVGVRSIYLDVHEKYNHTHKRPKTFALWNLWKLPFKNNQNAFFSVLSFLPMSGLPMGCLRFQVWSNVNSSLKKKKKSNLNHLQPVRMWPDQSESFEEEEAGTAAEVYLWQKQEATVSLWTTAKKKKTDERHWRLLVGQNFIQQHSPPLCYMSSAASTCHQQKALHCWKFFQRASFFQMLSMGSFPNRLVK